MAATSPRCLADDTPRTTLADIAVQFDQLPDPRCHINRRHPLDSVIVIAILAILAGCNGPTAIARWARVKQDFLVRGLHLPHGIPRKDVFRLVLTLLNPTLFQACFAEWLQALWQSRMTELAIDRPVLSVDGKTNRRSHDKANGLGALHTVSVWAGELGLSLGQVACADKSNEITAIPTVLSLIDIKGTIITIDALGTQRQIARQIVAAEADYVLALKGNQGTLHDAIIDYVGQQLDDDFVRVAARRHTVTETSHGKVETRTYLQFPVPKDLPMREDWAGLKTIGMATRWYE
jgi:predicted transposase YbfD/YdcC